ncbi:MAG: MBL fold metallo-hydrolase [Clostridia bacterium]|nr:MBL fold metallo-hydrolase [Clostridia bacterium]
MEIINLFPGSFASNCYVLISQKHAAIVDPSANADKILSVIEQKGAIPDMILLTHGHFDHIMSLDDLRDKSGVPAYIHRDDAELPEDAQKNAFHYFFHTERTYRRPERELQDGDTIPLGEEIIRVIHTPGHTRGSVCYQCGNLLLTGDTLFDGGYGRYDLYGGNGEVLFQTLHGMKRLGQTLTIYPGHGASANLSDALHALHI